MVELTDRSQGTADQASVDELDAMRQRRATRLFCDGATILLAATTIFAMLPGHEVWEVLVSAGSALWFAACSLVARTRRWRLAAVGLIAIVFGGVVLSSVQGHGALPMYFLATAVFYAAATMSFRGVLWTIGVGIAVFAGVAVYASGQGALSYHPSVLTTTAGLVFASTAIAAALVNITMRAVLKEATSRERRAQAAEARAMDGEERYRLVADNSNDLVMLSDEKRRCIYASPSHERVLGWPASHFVGGHLPDYIDPRDHGAATAAFRAAMTQGHGAATVRLVRADGAERFFDIVFTSIAHGGTRLIACAGRDITRQRHLAAQLQQAQKMNALGRLAGGVAHDFNNLLTVIQTCGSLAAKAPEISPRTREVLDEALAASTRAATLTRQLLRFSRREVVTPILVDLKTVLGDAVALAKRLVGADVEVVADVPDDIWSVLAAPTQIEQIVLNLAANARDAMPKGGTLRIAAQNREPSAPSPTPAPTGQLTDELVQIVISDTGEGMSEEALAHAFEPFFTTKQAGLGTGLGLATCYGIVEQLRGTISVASTRGTGTTFTVLLPRATTETAAVSPPPSAVALERPPRSGTVLVVDDEAPVRTLMARVVEDLGYTVLSAASLEEARLQSGTSRIDVILTDIVLGADSGLDVMRLVRSAHPGAGVILTSGFVQDAEEISQHVAAGADFLHKPFAPEDLASCVERAFARLP